MTARDLSQVTAGYLEVAIWADLVPEGMFDIDDLSPLAVASARRDCEDFVTLIEKEGIDSSWWDDERLGHDFYLTRQGHGAGAWDRGRGETGEALTRLAKTFAPVDFYEGDDGLIHLA